MKHETREDKLKTRLLMICRNGYGDERQQLHFIFTESAQMISDAEIL